MRLLLLARAKWTVYAVCGGASECQVLDILIEAGAPGIRLLSDLREYVPSHGPGHNEEFTKVLRDGIFEFRQPTNRGPTPRVLFFYDKGFVIVCAVACLKKSNKTPDSLIDQAVGLRERYRRDRDARKLEIVDALDDLDED
jgi:putative component of toxin-antitoxin plasmid stabilization module